MHIPDGAKPIPKQDMFYPKLGQNVFENDPCNKAILGVYCKVSVLWSRLTHLSWLLINMLTLKYN